VENAWVQFQPEGRILTAFDPLSLGMKRFTLGRNTTSIEIIPDSGWQALPRLDEASLRRLRLSRSVTFATKLPSNVYATALDDRHLRFWSEDHNPVSPRLPLPKMPTGFALENDGTFLLIRFIDGSVGRMRMPPTSEAPRWLPSFAELTARARLRPDRSYHVPKGIAAIPVGDDAFATYIRQAYMEEGLGEASED
jgi:hypothetical protein